MGCMYRFGCECIGVNVKLKCGFGKLKFSVMVTQFGEISVIVIERV